MEKKKNFHLIEKISKELDFTPDILLHGITVEVYGGRQAIVEGIKNILEYDENILRVNNGNQEVRITGTALMLRSMTQDSVLVEGNITSAEYSGSVLKK